MAKRRPVKKSGQTVGEDFFIGPVPPEGGFPPGVQNPSPQFVPGTSPQELFGALPPGPPAIGQPGGPPDTRPRDEFGNPRPNSADFVHDPTRTTFTPGQLVNPPLNPLFDPSVLRPDSVFLPPGSDGGPLRFDSNGNAINTAENDAKLANIKRSQAVRAQRAGLRDAPIRALGDRNQQRAAQGTATAQRIQTTFFQPSTDSNRFVPFLEELFPGFQTQTTGQIFFQPAAPSVGSVEAGSFAGLFIQGLNALSAKFFDNVDIVSKEAGALVSNLLSGKDQRGNDFKPPQFARSFNFNFGMDLKDFVQLALPALTKKFGDTPVTLQSFFAALDDRLSANTGFTGPFDFAALTDGANALTDGTGNGTGDGTDLLGLPLPPVLDPSLLSSSPTGSAGFF